MLIDLRSLRAPRHPFGFGFGCCCVSETFRTFGGFVGGSGALDLMYQYDFSSDAYSSTGGTMPGARSSHGFCTVSGVLWSAGNANQTNSATSTNEKFESGSWTAKATLAPGRGYGAMQDPAGTDNYHWGGVAQGGGGFSTTKNDGYNIAGNSWSSKTALPVAVQIPGFAALSGYAYSIAGAPDGGTVNGIVRRYDPSGNSWSTRTSLPSPNRTGGRSDVFGGNIHYCCGYNGSTTYYPDLEEYNESGDAWNSLTDMPASRLLPGVVAGANHLFVTGGNTGGGSYHNDTYAWDGSAWTTRATAPFNWGSMGTTSP